MNLTSSEHLQLYNHGYAVGWNYLRSNPGVGLNNMGKKLLYAFEGASLGFTAFNLPFGREGIRRAVDLQTPLPGTGLLWRLIFGGLVLLGIATLWTSGPRKMPWLLVAGSKLIIVLAFFGFARQMVSIYPVFYLIIALAIDRVLSWLPVIKPLSRRAAGLAAATSLALLCVLEIAAATSANHFVAEGRLQPLGGFGEQAFTSNTTLVIRKQNAAQPGVGKD